MSTFTVRLNRTDAQPWGFRLQGGKDFGAPLAIQKVNVGSIADQAGLIAGDNVISVNNVEVFNLRHKDAQDVIVRSGNNFDFTVQRGGSTWKPSVTPTGQVPSPVPHATTQSVQTVTKTSLAKQHQEIRSIGTGYNNAAKPFAGQTNGSGDAPMKSIVNKQYNTPVGIYSEESIAETLSAQAEVLAGGVLGVNFKKNEKIYNAANSEVLKALHDAEYDEPEQATDQTHTPASVTKHVSAPIDRPAAPTTGGLPPGQNICADCERLIVGVFVRIKDKNLHVDCFKCSTCGSNLKNQGYFNINNKLYCDIHAKLAAINSPPPGTEGYSPVPIAPNTKLGASTISAALNAHANGNGISPQPIAPQLNDNSVHSSHSRTSSTSSTSTASLCSNKGVSPTYKPSSAELMSQSSLHTIYVDRENEKNRINVFNNNAPIMSSLPRNHGKISDDVAINNNCHNKDQIDCNVMDNGYTESLYGTIRPHAKAKPNDAFSYKTLNGSIIRSVHPPGKGVDTKYKLNSSLSGPKPFNTVAAPVYIPTASPKSPSSYPPPSSGNNTWSAPTPISAPTFAPPKPAVTFDASVLPKPAGQNAPAPPPTPKPLHLNTITQSDKPIIRGHATDLLEQSVKDLKVNQNDNFKFEAGKIISLMLENRSHAMKPAVSDLGRQLNPSHPMHTIIDHCDNSPPPPPPPQFTPTFTVSATLCNNDELLPPPPSTPELANPKIVTTLSISPINPNGTNLEKDGNWSSDDSLGPKHLQPSVTASAFPANSLNTPSNSDSFNSMVNDNNNVILRNKNAKPELTKHARDRRSYIEKDEQVTTNNEETTAIASELKDGKQPVCCCCNTKITRGPFITALGRIWCPEHFVCVNANCRRHLQDIGFVEEKGELYCEYCFEKFLAPNCNKCNNKIKGDCLNAIGKQFHPECFTCTYCGKLFGNSPFFLEEGEAYCETDWNELFTTKCFSCGFPVEAGDKWVEALSHNYHSQCFNCTMCKKNLEGQSFYAKGGRPYCKTHAR